MISIAMTAYNGERYLRKQLDSILTQTYTEWELVVCDDCSSDGTVEILNEYAQTDSRIKVYVNEHNLGFRRNFEKAMGLCSGEYIALCDQDDVWTDNHLDLLISNIGDCDLIGGNAFIVDSGLQSMNTTMLEIFGADISTDSIDDWFFFLLHGNIFQGAAMMFRKSLLSCAVPIPDNVRFHDYWLALHASVRGGVTYIKECILYYRQHGNNVTQNEKRNFVYSLRNLFKDTKRRGIQLQLSCLKEFHNVLADDEKKKKVLYVSKYFESLLKLIRVSAIPYFIRNYKVIYRSNDNKHFILRFVKNFIFCR